MLTLEQINHAKNMIGFHDEKVYEHDDCIKIAYEWLDAQKKVKNSIDKPKPLKHYIEDWAGRYISKDDVVVAAYIHPEIHGEYPLFNISSRLVKPSLDRLKDIGESFSHNKSSCIKYNDTYSGTEDNKNV